MRSRPALKHAYAALLAALALACSGSERAPRSRFVLALAARTDDGEPVSDTRFWADGRELGATDRQGRLVAELSAHEGEVVTLWPACPAAFRTLTASRRLVLQKLRTIGKPDVDFELSALCAPQKRVAALAVRVRGPELADFPIRIAGEVAGQTEADGSAHLLIHVAPNSALRVQLDTSAYPRLVPRDPVQRFELGDSDNIVLFEQTFTLAQTPERRGKRREPAPSAAPRLPYRLGGR